MPLTPSQKSAAFRKRRAAKIERYEAALREIAEMDAFKGVPAQDIAKRALHVEV